MFYSFIDSAIGPTRLAHFARFCDKHTSTASVSSNSHQISDVCIPLTVSTWWKLYKLALLQCRFVTTKTQTLSVLAVMLSKCPCRILARCLWSRQLKRWKSLVYFMRKDAWKGLPPWAVKGGKESIEVLKTTSKKLLFILTLTLTNLQTFLTFFSFYLSLELTPVKNFSGALLKGRLVVLPANIRLGWKGLPRTNALAFYEKS
jgi:hypothetical protein